MLRSIEINNYRSCYQTKLEFDQALCALIGKNGVGKTNILKAIEWLAGAVIIPEPIMLWSFRRPAPEIEETSIRVHLELDEHSFEYSLTAPPIRTKLGDQGRGLSEALTVRDSEADVVIFDRVGEQIRIPGRTEPIRVGRWTPCIPALLSLLPGNDPIQGHLVEIQSFLERVRYYPLGGPPPEGSEDFVLDQDYRAWRARFAGGGAPPNSAAMRLIAMWEEDQELFKEFAALIGPDGLGLLAQVQIAPESSGSPSIPPGTTANGPAPKIYWPLFTPSAGMGGERFPFRFSELSAGTRRMIEIVAAVLFDQRSLMLTEQPEESIHPGLLRKLVDLLRSYSGGSQMIFTTHSSEVLDMLQPEEVILVTADDGITKARKLSPTEISEAKRFLKNDGSLSDYLEFEPTVSG